MDLAVRSDKPQPLSPGDFNLTKNSAGEPPTSRPADLLQGDAILSDASGIDASDRLTLQTALNLLRVARAGATSADIKTAKQANLEIVRLLSYLSGFIDAKGKPAALPSNPGFDSFVGKTTQLSLPMWLDRVEAALEQLLSPETRRPNPYKLALQTAGDAIVGAGGSLIAVGVGLLLVPAP